VATFVTKKTSAPQISHVRCLSATAHHALVLLAADAADEEDDVLTVDVLGNRQDAPRLWQRDVPGDGWTKDLEWWLGLCHLMPPSETRLTPVEFSGCRP
jgi:hypothetical protein